MAVKYAREQGAQVLSICNTQGATIPRESDAVIYTHAGPEVAVGSTKAFLAQGVALYLLGLHLATLRGTLTTEQVAEQVAELEGLPAELQQTIEDASGVAELAKWMADTRSVLFLGRHVGYPIALRARSSSRSSRTSTRRASRRASSSTARSRSSSRGRSSS